MATGGEEFGEDGRVDLRGTRACVTRDDASRSRVTRDDARQSLALSKPRTLAKLNELKKSLLGKEAIPLVSAGDIANVTVSGATTKHQLRKADKQIKKKCCVFLLSDFTFG